MRYEDPNSQSVLVVGIVFGIILAATTLAAQGYFYWSEHQEEVRKYAQPNAALTQYRAEQAEMLMAYGRDEASGAVRIPVDQAAELLLAERAAQ